ncbi:hypothetical protein ACI79P_19240 [Blastococcus sp. SYSU DS0510]
MVHPAGSAADGGRPAAASHVRTGLALTQAGRAAFDAHVAELRRITGG